MSDLVCQICSTHLEDFTLDQRQEHYERHFDEQLQSSTRKRKRNFHLPGTEPESDVFWYSSLKSSPPRGFTPGLIPLLRKSLLSSHAKGKTVRAVLCYSGTVHICKQLWDMNWGCGYRNFLMVCTALMDQPIQPLYFALLDQPIPPGMRNLQQWLEDAWRAGFDLEGAQQLKKLVGTKKWLGTSDLYTAFVFRGIPCRLVDFNDLQKSRGCKPVIDWVVQYFTATPHSAMNANQALWGASPVLVTDLMPLILQHQGHSRVVVGCEVLKNNDINLLVFDSGQVLSKPSRRAALRIFEAANTNISSESSKRAKTSGPVEVIRVDDSDNEENEIVCIGQKRHELDDKIPSSGNFELSEMSPFRLPARKLKHDKYQILYFPLDSPLTESEKNRMRIVTALKI